MSRAAWILAPEHQPVPVATAPTIRVERMRRWLAGSGYAPEVCSRLGGPGGDLTVDHASYRRGRGTPRAALNTVAALVTAPRLAARCLREAPALILANTPVHAPALALAKLCLGSRVLTVVDVMGLHSLEAKRTTRHHLARSLHPRAWRALERLLLRSADVVFVVNDRHGELVREIEPATRPHTLRDCAESRLQVSGTANGGPVGALSVAFLGALVCGRLDPVLDAWEVLGAEPTAPRLVVVGDGPDLAGHRRRVAASPALARSVTLCGALPRPQALAAVASCDVGCSDCWSDAGFPAKAFEYMALGLPALIQDRSQVREVLEHGETALLWADPGELVGQVHALAGDPGLRERLGAAGREALVGAHTEDLREQRFLATIATEAR